MLYLCATFNPTDSETAVTPNWSVTLAVAS